MPYSEFETRKAAVLERRNLESTDDAEEKTKLQCKVCRKTFGTANAERQHLNSKKHKAAEKKSTETWNLVPQEVKSKKTNGSITPVGFAQAIV